jgi:hypothetical protein
VVRKENIRQYRLPRLGRTGWKPCSTNNMKKKHYSDMKHLRSLKDEEIDTSDIPELDASFFEKAVVSLPRGAQAELGQKIPVPKQSLGTSSSE